MVKVEMLNAFSSYLQWLLVLRRPGVCWELDPENKKAAINSISMIVYKLSVVPHHFNLLHPSLSKLKTYP